MKDEDRKFTFEELKQEWESGYQEGLNDAADADFRAKVAKDILAASMKIIFDDYVPGKFDEILNGTLKSGGKGNKIVAMSIRVADELVAQLKAGEKKQEAPQREYYGM